MNAHLQLDCMGSQRCLSEGTAVSKGAGVEHYHGDVYNARL